MECFHSKWEFVLFGLLSFVAGDASSAVFAADPDEEPRALGRHERQITSIAFSPDDRTFATADAGGEIVVWELETGKVLTRLKSARRTAHFLAFFPSGDILASAGRNGVELWDVTEGVQRAKQPARAEHGVAVSPDGKFLVIAGNERLRVFNVGDNALEYSWESPFDKVVGMRFTAGGLLLTAEDIGSVKVWHVASGVELESRRLETGKNVVVSLPNERVRITRDDRVVRAAFSPNGALCALACEDPITAKPSRDDFAVELWDLAARRRVFVLEGHKSSVKSLAFSPDGKFLASGTGSMFRLRLGKTEAGWYAKRASVQENLIRLWDVATGREARTLSGSQHSIDSLAFHPKTAALVSGSRIGEVMLWNAFSDRERLHGP